MEVGNHDIALDEFEEKHTFVKEINQDGSYQVVDQIVSCGKGDILVINVTRYPRAFNETRRGEYQKMAVKES
jgi:hypothetical protein